jgi:hypothetical protein
MKKYLLFFILFLSYISFSCSPGFYRHVKFKEIGTENLHSRKEISSMLFYKFKFLKAGYQDDKVTCMGGLYPSETTPDITLHVRDGLIEVILWDRADDSENQDQIAFVNELKELCENNKMKFKIKKYTPWNIGIPP